MKKEVRKERLQVTGRADDVRDGGRRRLESASPDRAAPSLRIMSGGPFL
jgi:hypothetical protein